MRKTLKVVAFGGGPADAFIKAAGITDSTQQTAIKTLVNDLNGYGLWTKMKAIYPMVGGNATAHSYNLKDTTKFQIAFSGGWTHDSTGALPNGTNAYGDTKLVGTVDILSSNAGMGIYSGTQGTSAGAFGTGPNYHIFPRYTDNNTYYRLFNASGISNNNGSSLGLIHGYSNGTNSYGYYNSASIGSMVVNNSGDSLQNLWLARMAGNYDNHQLRFAFASLYLTNTEAANLYTSIQKFQTTLNRFVGTPIVSDSDAQTFLNTASITDLTQANAVNTLVTDLKGANLWTKMKAVYPMVGGTATSHSYNLKNPSQFQITWNGGITHSSTGALPNGTNGFGDTNLNALSNLTYNSTHLAYYSRTANGTGSGKTELGTQNGASSIINLGVYTYSAQVHACAYNNSSSALLVNNSTNNSSGFYVANRASSTSLKSYRNAVSFGTNSNTSAGTIPNNNIYLAANGNTSSKYEYSDRECAFASIGDGLTDSEVTTLYNIVQTYETTLSRNI